MKVLTCHLGVFVSMVLLLLGSTAGQAQVYLYLEDMTEVQAIKIPVGSSISIKTIDNQEWTSYRIERLLDKEGIIILGDGTMLEISDITHIRRQRKWVKAFSYTLQTFGFAWGLYGSIIMLADSNGSTWGIVLTGSLVPIATAYLMRKIWLWKKYKIGKKNRLKVLDLSFPVDPYGEKEKPVKYYP